MKSTLTPLVIFAAAIGLTFLFSKPTYEDVQKLRSEIQKNEEAIERAESVVAKRDALRAKKNTFNPEDLKRLQLLFHDKIDNIKLIIEIDSIATRYKTSIKNIKVATAAEAAPDTKAATAIGGQPKVYGTTEIGFGVTLSYDEFIAFLSDVEKSLRLTDISSVTFTPKDDNDTYDFTVTLATYWLK
jgi:hypothetical protein